MTGFLRFILFFVVFLLVLRLIRLISRYWSSSRKKNTDIHQQHTNSSQKFKDVEEADFKELPADKKNDD